MHHGCKKGQNFKEQIENLGATAASGHGSIERKRCMKRKRPFGNGEGETSGKRSRKRLERDGRGKLQKEGRRDY
jgi:hypothetical protein